jgi:hypothetical protein
MHAMNGRLVVAAMVAVAMPLGGNTVASAAMIITSEPFEVTAEAAKMPPMDAPAVALGSGRPVVSWNSVVTSAGSPVDRYLVIRRVGSDRELVCQVSAPTRSCRDDRAPAGRTVVYLVRAVEGANWVSRDSAPSSPLILPVESTQLAEPTGDAPQPQVKTSATTRPNQTASDAPEPTTPEPTTSAAEAPVAVTPSTSESPPASPVPEPTGQPEETAGSAAAQ